MHDALSAPLVDRRLLLKSAVIAAALSGPVASSAKAAPTVRPAREAKPLTAKTIGLILISRWPSEGSWHCHRRRGAA
jgi:hypothetical protein